MRLTPSLRTVAILAAVIACILPAAGCGGGRKKGEMTIEQLRKKAEAEKTPEGQARELVKVARLQVKGDRTGAQKTLDEALKRIPDDGDPAACVPRLIEIVDAYVLIDKKKEARKVAERAGKSIAALDDPMTKAEFFAQLGALYAAKDDGLGDVKLGTEVLEMAKKLAQEDVQEGFRAKALAAVAIGYADAGLAAEATDMIEALEKMAGELEEPRRKAEALAVAARVRAAGGENEAAAALLADAAKAARGIDGAANRTYALLSVGKAALAAKDKKLAKSLAADADKSAAKIGDPEQNKEAVQKVRAFERLVEKK